MALPAGVKDVKLNLTNAYRTTFTHIQKGDDVRVEARRDGWAIIPSATHAPKRSYWANVVGVEKVGRQVRITLATGAVMTDFPHTAITRKERAAEYKERLETDAQAREDSLRAIEEERIQKALADHPTESRQEVWERIVADTKTDLNQVPCTKCTGTADNHFYGVTTEGGVEILCIGVAPATIAQRKALAMPLEEPANTVAAMLELASGDYNAVRRSIETCLAQELALPDTKAEYTDHYHAQLRVLAEMEAAVSATRPATIQVTHEFYASAQDSGMVCTRLVERPDGSGDACGEPVNSPVHEPAKYLAYATELRSELDRFSLTSWAEKALASHPDEDPAIFAATCPKCLWRRDNVTRTAAAALRSQHLTTHEAEMTMEAHAALESLQKELQDLRWEREKYAALLVDLVHMHEDSQDALRDLNARGEDVHSATYASALGRHNALQDVVNRSKAKTYPATY